MGSTVMEMEIGQTCTGTWTVHGHVWRTLCSVCGTRDGRSTPKNPIEEGGGAKKEPGQMKWSLYEMFPVCKHVSGCFIFFITNKSNTATPTMKKMY